MTLRYFTDFFEGWLEHLERLLATTSLPEIVAALTLPLLALLIGIRINRSIDSRPIRTLNAKLIDFFAPLISPVLAILFTLIVTVVLVQTERSPVLMPFVLKLCVVWLAVHLVMTLSSGKTAGIFIVFIILPITLLHMFDVWDYTVEALNEVSFTIGSMKFNLYLIFKAIITLVTLLWIVNFILDTTDTRLRRMRGIRASNRTLVVKFLQIGLYIVVFLFGLNLVGVSLTTLSIFSGALGVGIGLGLQKIASNFISGIILLFEKSMEIGDLVEMEDGTKGFIRRTSGRYTLIEQYDGSEALIPNENFINQQVVNFTHTNGHGRGEIRVGVSYDSDLDHVKDLLVAAATGHPRCAKDPVAAAFVEGFGDSSINMLLYFWVDDVEIGILGIKSDITIAIVNSFRAAKVVIPYPHQVAVLPEDIGLEGLANRRPDLRKPTKANDKGSKAEAKQIAQGAPISKVGKE